jgi:hypothetical protein
MLVFDRQLQYCPARRGSREEGGRKALSCADDGVSSAERPELYRTWSIHHGSGYRRIYGETTKHAQEASVLSAHNPQRRNGVEGYAV